MQTKANQLIWNVGGLAKSRYAFSLLEVLIAMALGAFLMLAIFEAFFVSARYRMLAGESHVRCISLSNALRDLTSDMLAAPNARVERGLAQPLESQSLESQPLESPELKLQSKLIPQSMNFRDSFALDSHLEWTQFVGKKNYVALRARAWSSRFSRVPMNVSQSGESLIVWWLYQGTQPRVEGWRNKDLGVSKTLKLPPNPSGLIRTQFFIDRAGEEREYSEVILPEAVGLELRYYNGNELNSDWDAADVNRLNKNRLPTAIEVRVKVEKEEFEHWIHIPCDGADFSSGMARAVR